MEVRTVDLGGLDYRITEDGQIFKRRGSGFITLHPDKDGYLRFTTTIDRQTYNEHVHRIVYRAFVGEIPESATIDHKDSNILNNHFSNLQPMSAEENAIKGNARTWKFLTPFNEEVEIYNLKDFCRQNDLHAGHMAQSNLTRSHKGWRRIK